MPKPDRLLKLLHLFSHRKVVSLKSIMTECEMPRRTAFRYLRELSEANIPIYFDKEHRGYRLSNPITIRLDDLPLQEIVILASCLDIVRQSVNKGYQEEINLLVCKLVARQPFSKEVFSSSLAMQGREGAGLSTNHDYSQELSFALAHAAIAVGSQVSVSVSRATGPEDELHISQPSLAFLRTWELVDRADSSGKTAIELDNIVHVRIPV